MKNGWIGRQLPRLFRETGFEDVSMKARPVFVPLQTTPLDSNSSDARIARTAVGLNEGGTTMYVVVVQAGPVASTASPASQGSVTATALSTYMKDIGAWDAINLDKPKAPKRACRATGGILPPHPQLLRHLLTPEERRGPPRGPGASAGRGRTPTPSWSPRCDTLSSPR